MALEVWGTYQDLEGRVGARYLQSMNIYTISTSIFDYNPFPLRILCPTSDCQYFGLRVRSLVIVIMNLASLVSITPPQVSHSIRKDNSQSDPHIQLASYTHNSPN